MKRKLQRKKRKKIHSAFYVPSKIINLKYKKKVYVIRKKQAQFLSLFSGRVKKPET